jgi:glycosyltransferase involved in cell wall biosynthesis
MAGCRVPLSVLSVAYPFAPVTADPAGGAEQVLAQVDRALVAAGHRSVVIACEGSAVAGELLTVPASPDAITDARRAEVHAAVRAAIAGAGAFDLVHLHGIDFAAYLPDAGRTLVTLHLPLDWYGPLDRSRRDLWLLPVSASQAARVPGADLLPPIGNGVDLDRYRPGAKGAHLLVLGRVAPEKGFADAIDAARLAGVPLVAAGPAFPYPEHRAYLDEQVRPRLDDERRWVGAVAGEEKARLLAGARALLVPSTAPETSSLVAMEALASGTPVIAYRSGALPEIVEDGVTGYLVDDVAGMAAAIGRADAIDPAACRRAAEARFDVRATTAAYLDLFGQLARC